jgi:hypothetical protein
VFVGVAKAAHPLTPRPEYTETMPYAEFGFTVVCKYFTWPPKADIVNGKPKVGWRIVRDCVVRK